jgi:ethanolamine utilization cobalamin adenosyltransferase
MDIRIYFQKVREIESSIKEPFVVVASLETPDGGKAGTLTEVTPSAAARLVVEGKARLANADETSEYRVRAERTRSEAEQVLAKSKMQFTLLTEQESKALRSARPKS